MDSRLRAFLRFRPKLLHAHDPLSGEKAFPSPRSWEFVSRILDARPGREALGALLRGAVGEAAALECLGYLDICDSLPETDAVLANPGGVRIPEEPAAIYALCESVARKASDGAMPSLAVLAGRLPVEFGVLLMRDAAATEPSIVETEAFKGWACANSDVLVV